MSKNERSLKTVVGSETYRVWTAMLQQLVPDGRTHRLAPLVAGMLQYALTIVSEKYGEDPGEGSVAQSLISASESDDIEEVMGDLRDMTEQLFKDAGVGYARTNSRGDGYSIAENAIYEFIHWHAMPWET